MILYGQILLLAALILIFPLSTHAGSKLLVTKEVLVEYVRDRLSKLEGREKLDKEQTAELNFIRENSDNLQALADFYGMRIREKTLPKIPVQKETSASREESGKELSQSYATTPDAMEWERKRRLVEAVPTKASEPDEKSIKALPAEKMSQGKRAEKGEERMATQDIEMDETATSLVQTPPPTGKPEKAITAQKSVPPPQLAHIEDLKHTYAPNKIRATGRIHETNQTNEINQTNETNQIVAQPEPPPPIITEEEVRQFLQCYKERYIQKDIYGFLSLFSYRAVQNGRVGFSEIKEIYSDFFGKSRELRYHLKDTRIEIYREVLISGLFYESAALVEARYQLDQTLDKKEEKKAWKGDIRWILVRENEALKILHLDFKHE